MGNFKFVQAILIHAREHQYMDQWNFVYNDLTEGDIAMMIPEDCMTADCAINAVYNALMECTTGADFLYITE